MQNSNMAPSTKRKAEDDFVLTISDNEDSDVLEEEEFPASPKLSAKKRKRESALVKKNKKAKKGEDNTEDAGDEEGIWGAKDEDDGAMDSEFEFMMEDDNNGAMEEFEGWGFDGARKGLENCVSGDKKAVDIDEIIARRREKRGKGKLR